MEYFSFALILAAAFLPALLLVLKTNQSKKRGCGRGCATCGNRAFCHRRALKIPSRRPPK